MANESVYKEFNVYKGKKKPPGTQDNGSLRPFFFEFFKQFRDYLAEYTRESLNELIISDIDVSEEPKVIFEDVQGQKVVLKNQGGYTCRITTNGQGKYDLSPREKITFWVNRPVVVTTFSGTTSLGFILS